MSCEPHLLNRPWLRVLAHTQSPDLQNCQITLKVDSVSLFFRWVAHLEEQVLRTFLVHGEVPHPDYDLVNVYTVAGRIGVVFCLELRADNPQQTHLIARALTESHCYLPV